MMRSSRCVLALVEHGSGFTLLTYPSCCQIKGYFQSRKRGAGPISPIVICLLVLLLCVACWLIRPVSWESSHLEILTTMRYQHPFKSESQKIIASPKHVSMNIETLVIHDTTGHMSICSVLIEARSRRAYREGC